MTRKQKRLAIIVAIGLVLAVSVGLILTALRDQIVFFYSPSEIIEKHVEVGTPIRIGGMVLEDTWKQDGLSNVFVIHDYENQTKTNYTGILPDLFREGQGVVVEGSLQVDGTFLATNVLAKHDENYMPREVADTLRNTSPEVSPVAQ